MNDMAFDLMTCLDRHIVNTNLLHSKDRDIKDIIRDCYAYLKGTILVGWNEDLADLRSTFETDYKEFLVKLGKNINVPYSVDINNIDNVFSKLQLKYLIDPETVSPKFRRSALEITLEEFDREVEGYQNINWDAKRILEEALERIEKDPPKTEERSESGLFVKEQTIIVPEIDKTGKYIIDGISYYGVYNSAESNRITSKGERVAMKVVTNGKYYTVYEGIEDDEMFGKCLYIEWFSYKTNPFHLLCTDEVKNHKPTDLLVFKREEPEWEELIMNTYRQALYMDEHPKEFQKVEKEASKLSIPDEKSRIRANLRRTKIDVNIAVKTLLQKRNGEPTPVRNFIHLGKLEEVILSDINETGKGDRRLDPKLLTKRINLKPNQILSKIKTSSDEMIESVLFRDNKRDPNPFDIFNLFAYAHYTQHTETKDNKKIAANAKKGGKEDDNWIKFYNLDYLGVYFSKNGTPLGKNTILHFHIPDEIISSRQYKKVIHHDIYTSPLL